MAGATPLYKAAENGHTDVVELLVTSGATKDQATTDTGATPLFAAASKGHAEVATALLAYGASKKPAAGGLTPHQAARQAGHSALAKMLK